MDELRQSSRNGDVGKNDAWIFKFLCEDNTALDKGCGDGRAKVVTKQVL